MFANRLDGTCMHIEEKEDVLAIHGFKVAIFSSDEEEPFWLTGLGSRAVGGMVSLVAATNAE